MEPHRDKFNYKLSATNFLSLYYKIVLSASPELLWESISIMLYLNSKKEQSVQKNTSDAVDEVIKTLMNFKTSYWQKYINAYFDMNLLYIH